MALHVEVLSGARRGHRRVFGAPRVMVGRHPDCDLQFDPEEDREVSARHAVLGRVDGRWLVRDLDSRNGTFVDGTRITENREVADGTRIQFGREGPQVEIRVRPASYRTRPASGPGSPPGRPPAADGGGSRDAADPSGLLPPELRDAGTRGRVARTATTLLVLVLAGLGGLLLWTEEPEGERARRERPEQPGRADRVRTSAEGNPEPGSSSSRDSGSAANAPAIDLAAIESSHWRAVARLYVEGPTGEVVTATAFSVRPDGLLVTARHAVLSQSGAPASRLGVQFARSTQVWPAELVATTDSADLALIRARNIVGEVPVVGELSARPDTLIGSDRSVALLGYSGSPTRETGDSVRADVLARPRPTAGVLVGRDREGLLQIRGSGAKGGSGSPIFDGSGQVIGVLRGGAREQGGGRLLVAVPSPLVRAFITAALERTSGP